MCWNLLLDICDFADGDGGEEVGCDLLPMSQRAGIWIVDSLLWELVISSMFSFLAIESSNW